MTEPTPYGHLKRMAAEALPLLADPGDRLILTAGYNADSVAVTLELVSDRPGELYDPARAHRIVPEAELLSRLRAMAEAFRDAYAAHMPAGQPARALLSVTLTITNDGTFSVGTTSLDGAGSA